MLPTHFIRPVRQDHRMDHDRRWDLMNKWPRTTAEELERSYPDTWPRFWEQVCLTLGVIEGEVFDATPDQLVEAYAQRVGYAKAMAILRGDA